MRANLTVEHIKSRLTPVLPRPTDFAISKRHGALHNLYSSPIDTETFIRKSLARGCILYPDSSLIIQRSCEWVLNMAERVGSIKSMVSAALTCPIFDEVRPCISSPTRRSALLGKIRVDLGSRGDGWICHLNHSVFSGPNACAARYYFELLALRRRIALPQMEDGRPVEDQEFNPQRRIHDIKRMVGARAASFAPSSQGYLRKRGRLVLNDEEHVVTVFWTTLGTGRPGVIVTKDRGMFDMFYKLWYLLDTDYTSWHVAMRLKQGGYRKLKVTAADDEMWLFDGELEAYEQVSPDFAEAFDGDFVSTSLAIVLLNDDNSAHIEVVRLPRDLNAYLSLKPLSDWRNTSQFGDRNVHIGLNVVSDQFKGVIGVAKDRTKVIGGGIRVNLIDAHRAIHDVEQHITQTRVA